MSQSQTFPGVITRVVAQEHARKHLGQRVNVFIADRFSFALSAELAFKHGLRPGLEINPQFLDTLLREDGETKALTVALNFIGFRPRSSSEVRTRLARDEWPDTVIDAVLAKLQDLSLLNDAEFATRWVESRSTFKPRGGRLLQQELRQKGVAKEDIEAALPDSETEVENALAALRKLERKLAPHEGREQERKAIEMLGRKGFNFGTSRDAWRRLQEQDEEDES